MRHSPSLDRPYADEFTAHGPAISRRSFGARSAAVTIGAAASLQALLNGFARFAVAGPPPAGSEKDADAHANSAQAVATDRANKAPAPRAKACILIWLDGGPSHLDLWDLKPAAPQEIRGPFRAIATATPGVALCEYLPRTAALSERLAIVRSVTSTLGEHNLGTHYVLTGYKPSPALTYPSFGAVRAHLAPSHGVWPDYVAIPDAPALAGAGFLPASARPFEIGGDPSQPNFRVRNLELYTGIDAARLERRREFLQAFDRNHSGPGEIPPIHAPAGSELSPALSSPDSRTPDDPFAAARRLIASPAAKRAFDLSQEPAEVRARYGTRSLGQSCLLARRLVEAGAPFVAVTDRGWDTHQDLVRQLKEGYTGGSVGKIPLLDAAYASLLSDLSERGLLDQTLVLLMGEFGRTPRVNTSQGRDHWSRVFSVVLAGGGVPGGQVIGASDARGESPAQRPILPEDLACTIYRQLGVDPQHELLTPDGRPVPVNQGGQLIRELTG